MSKQASGLKAVPVPADKIMLVDSENSGNLTEALVSSFLIDHISLYTKVGKVSTYRVYSDPGETIVIGTIITTDGNDGSGSTAATYSSSTSYIIDVLVVSTGTLYRSLQAANLGNTPPVDGIDTAFWEVLTYFPPNLLRLSVVPIATQQVVNGAMHRCDTTVAGFTLNVTAAEVDTFRVWDKGNSWTDANPLIVSIGTDTFTFGTAQAGNRYEFFKDGSTFIAYDQHGAETVGNI